MFFYGNIYKVFLHKDDMMKKGLVLLFVGLIIFSIVINFVSANVLTDIFDSNWLDLKDAGTIKVLLLFIIVGIIFSAFGFMNFPENAGIRFALSAIVGFLVTSFINPNEIAAAMVSYRALGIAIILFLPIIVLGAITFQVIIKGQFVGVVLQRILWLIYSIYLFGRSAFPYIWRETLQTSFESFKNKWVVTFTTSVNKMTETASAQDPFILFIQAIVAVVLFWVMFVKNEAVKKWLLDSKFNDQIEKIKGQLRKSREYDKAKAESFDQA